MRAVAEGSPQEGAGQVPRGSLPPTPPGVQHPGGAGSPPALPPPQNSTSHGQGFFWGGAMPSLPPPQASLPPCEAGVRSGTHHDPVASPYPGLSLLPSAPRPPIPVSPPHFGA